MFIFLTAICAAVAIAGFLQHLKHPTGRNMAITAAGAVGAGVFAVLAHLIH